MPAGRFFVEGRHAAGDVVRLEGSDAHKIVAVLRKRDGDPIEIVDSAAQRFSAALRIDGRDVRAELIAATPQTEPQPLHLAVAQGIPKGQKMDYVVEKLTELGAAEIVPLQSERTIADAGTNKLERWRRLAKTAAQQCGRDDIPNVTEPVRFDALLRQFGEYDAVLFPWELAERRELRMVLPGAIEGARRVLIVIGPEGGFSHAEADAAAEAGATLVSLGSRVLRTETAALVLAAVISYAAGV